ncbi:MAG: hypothetical protein QOF85_2085 [Solirubrobacterales bacterium]|nr:hypothetical protein [Solirubrobacterales bacterium]
MPENALIDSLASEPEPGSEPGAATPIPNPYDWDFLAEHVAEAPWSAAAREAGIWALERLREELGPRWPPAWKEPGGIPAEIASCFGALAGLVGTIDLALAFERLREADGKEHLRKSIKRGADQGRFASLRLQVQWAALAQSVGLDVVIEPLMPGAETKADLAIRGEGVELVIEAFAMLRDKRTMDASAWLDHAREGLRRIGEQFRVDFKGTVEAPLDDEETDVWLEEVRRYARLCAQGISLPPLEVGGVVITVEAGDPGGGSSFKMPTVSYGERLGSRLSKKAEQTKRSRARWLLIDSLDHLWHMTQWSQQPIAKRGEQLAALFRHELQDAEHLLGVVVSDGAALMRSEVPEQTVERPEFMALARRSDTWHIRESVVVPLLPEAEQALPVWRSILDAESGWVGRELRANGLAQLPELTVPRET